MSGTNPRRISELPSPKPALVTKRGTQIRSGWTSDRISLAFLAAMLPSLGIALLAGSGSDVLPILSVTLATIFAWQILFGLTRGSLVGWDGIVTALAISLMLPLSASPLETTLAASAGVVLGELIFGGRGRSFLNPAVVGIAFFSFSFPASATSASANLDIWPVILGGGILLVFRLVSWRVLLAGYIGLSLAAWLTGSMDTATILSPTFAFAILFLGAEPVSAAATRPGRWIYGFLIGVLAILFGGDDSVVFAILLASIFAPLIDQGAVWAIRSEMSRPWLN